MAHQSHRSHLRYAAVAGPTGALRRRPQRIPLIAIPVPTAGVSSHGAITGLVYALPASVLLWAGIVTVARVIF